MYVGGGLFGGWVENLVKGWNVSWVWGLDGDLVGGWVENLVKGWIDSWVRGLDGGLVGGWVWDLIGGWEFDVFLLFLFFVNDGVR